MRTHRQWDDQLNAGFPQSDGLYAPVVDDAIYGYHHVNVAARQADPESLLNRLKHALRIRREHPP